GLFVRTLINLQRVDPGFNTQNLLVVGIEPALIGYKEERLAHLYQQICERLETIPGVKAVTFSRTTPLAVRAVARGVFLRSDFSKALDQDGRVRPSGDCYIHQVRENFLEVMEIPLLAGRSLRAQDDARAPKVAVVNQAYAKKYFPNENPVGKRFTFDSSKPDEIEIVGLVKDAKYTRQRDDIPPTVYLSYLQQLREVPGVDIELRTFAEPTALVAAVRQAVQEVESNLPLNNVRTQVEQAQQTLQMERLIAKLITLFGLLAQQLAAIGLFGVMAYSVSQRTREIGIRLALGAQQFDVLKMVIKQGMTLTIIGIIFGLGSAYVLTKYLESWMQFSKMLYGIKPSDPMTYGVIVLLLMVVALIACYLPARRATKVDPLITLRSE
ncbi:MAG TPA: FtsX-like permease family protein, partial [Blastocatellia bacterium]|nr:FtsX-like permease family protein [Blastocatellia bacterium]